MSAEASRSGDLRRRLISDLVQNNMQPSRVVPRARGREAAEAHAHPAAAPPARGRAARGSLVGAISALVASFFLVGARAVFPTASVFGYSDLALTRQSPPLAARAASSARSPAPATAEDWDALSREAAGPVLAPRHDTGVDATQAERALAFLSGKKRMSLSELFHLRVNRIVIDPGHGGRDPGTVGTTLRLLEKDITLTIARRLRDRIAAELRLQVFLTRDDDSSLGLRERTRRANALEADLFLSIHINFFPNNSQRGVETFLLGFPTTKEAEATAARENAVGEGTIADFAGLVDRMMTTLKQEESYTFASGIHDHLYAGMNGLHGGILRDLGIKRAPFVVLMGAKMPSVLTEVSYLNDPAEELRLADDSYRNRIADLVFEGVRHYVEGRT